MRIAVDAMGGDFGPEVIVQGAVEGGRRQGVGILLVGDSRAIERALANTDHAGVDISVIEAPDVIAMGEHPANAVRRKPNNSISVGLRELSSDSVQAVVSAGNSGAVMAAALLVLGRISGVERPAIASYIPTATGRTLLLDLGAVTDPRPSNLVQFAHMGQVYAERVLGLPSPTLGLLSNGEEPTKGNAFVQSVYPLLEETTGITFVGNVEGKDVALGTVDIVVTDGFTGNVALKTAEGVATMMTDILRAELTATLPRKIAAFFLRPAFRSMRAKLDYAEIGGAPLLGVRGTVIISHGRSTARAIENAVGVAKRSAGHDLPGGILEQIERANQAAGA